VKFVAVVAVALAFPNFMIIVVKFLLRPYDFSQYFLFITRKSEEKNGKKEEPSKEKLRI